MPPLSERISRSIKLAHVQQLAQQQEPSLQDIPREAPPPTLRDSVIDWIQENPESLRAAQTTQCTSASPSSPNWDAVFFSIMESAVMYLRKPELMAQTIRAARAGDFDAAITYLDAAQEDIDSVAKKLDCTFIQLCDFSQEGPEGTWLHTGAFCGLFISNSTDKPFKGVAFKGSNSMRDFITDLDWDPILPLQPGIAWGAKVHRGFYHGLFGHFEVGTSSVTPFDVLVDALSSSYEKDAMLHFTGHSLGGAFCTLTYGEFLRLQNEPAFVKYDFGDMYSIASPRTCIQPFAAQFDKLTGTGSGKYAFRVVNLEDPVPTVPPRTSSQLAEYPFIHVSGAWKLQDDGPMKMDDEPPPVDPQSISDIVWNNAYHKISDYYATWQHTPHSGKED